MSTKRPFYLCTFPGKKRDAVMIVRASDETAAIGQVMLYLETEQPGWKIDRSSIKAKRQFVKCMSTIYFWNGD